MRLERPLTFACLSALLAATIGANANDQHEQPHQVTSGVAQVETVVENLEHPWGLALLPDGRFLVTERNPGHLRLGSVEGWLSEPLEGVPEIFRYEGETERSQAGLFDVKLHPDFDDNRLVYLSFSKPTDHGAALAIVRGRLSDDSTRLEAVEDIFEMKQADQSSDGLHFGGRMAIDADNEVLYLSIGDRRNISRAQDVEDQAGSILRMSLDGSAMGGQGDDENDRDSYIWSWGHRNPQGLAVNPDNGELWVADHGPKGGDEINRVDEGRNYGWPHYTGGVDYSGAPIGHPQPPEDTEPPLHVFSDTVAPSGLVFYQGEEFPEWQGQLLLGGMVSKSIVRLSLGDEGLVEEEQLLADMDRRIRDVQVAADGSVWAITEHADGEVLRLTAARGQ